MGWFQGSALKLYVANVSEELVESLYEKSMRDVVVEYLQLVAKGRDQTLTSVLFTTRRGFCEFFEHEYFTVSSINTEMTRLELFNFLPEVQAKAMCHQECELKTRLNHCNRVLHDFIFAYKAFQSGQRRSRDSQ